jgi:hypothetical protein
MYGGYLRFNNTEIANNQRVVAYLAGNPDLGIPGLRLPTTSVLPNCGCDTINLVCEPGAGPGGAYTTPRGDNAPWFDPDVPDSEDFAGLFVTEVTGFDSTVKRDFSDGAIDGGSLGPLRLAGRCITVTGWLRARTCCGAEYGLRWLQEALLGTGACDDCGYGDLYMIRCCPPAGDSCHTIEVSATETVNGPIVWFSLTNLGGGLYVFHIEDSNQANLVSDPAGGPNNTAGPIPSCYSSGFSFRFVLANAAGAIYTFFVPAQAITSFSTAPAGSGASATFTVDTNTIGSCDDAVRQIQNFSAQVAEYLAHETSGALIPTTSPTQVRCFDLVDGYNPADYVRILHRVGLTDGPKITDRQGTCCDNCGFVNLQVQFTLCSELPYVFSDIEWCIQDQTFDLDEGCYCLDVRKLCRSCSTHDATKTVEIEVARPPCGIDVLHDGSWCPVGWTTEDLGCIPTDCFLDINEVVAYDPEKNTNCTSKNVTDDTPCVIGLYGDGTWAPINFTIDERGFPPEFCDLALLFGGECSCPDGKDHVVKVVVDAGAGNWSITVTVNSVTDTTGPLAWNINSLSLATALAGLSNLTGFNFTVTGGPGSPGGNNPYTITFNPTSLGDVPSVTVTNLGLSGGAASVTAEVTQQGCVADNRCLIRVVYDEGTGSKTWEPIGWSGDLPAFPECDCVQIAEVCVIHDEGGCPPEVSTCPINIVCETAYRPNACMTRQDAAEFFYRYNGSPPFVPPATPTFTDVGVNHPARLEIEWAAAQGLLTGFGDGTFRPGDSLSRQAAAVAFYRYNGSPVFVPPATPSFTDVGTGHASYLEIEWCRSERIFVGFDDGSFRPGDCLLRRDASVAFYRDAKEQPTFTDVSCSDPGWLEIEWAYDQQIFDGFGDGTFRPTDPVTRREAAVSIYRAAGSPPFTPPVTPTFTDVPSTDPAYLEIEWAYAQGILLGFPGPVFLPDVALSRREAMAALYRWAGSPPFVPPVVQTFIDVPNSDPHYLEIEWAAAQGIAVAYPNGSFDPSSDTTRRQLAEFLYRNAGSPAYTPSCYQPTPPPYFADVPSTDQHFLTIEWLVDEGVTFGDINSRRWEPIGWDHDPEGVFPPENCRIVIATVNGEAPDMSPIKREVEVAFDEFVPDCGPFPIPPPVPLTFDTTCFCEPWEQTRRCCTFTNPADWNEATTYIEINTGSAELRNLKIAAYRNPFGEKVPCPCDPGDSFWDCRDPCATILVPQLPKQSTLVVDSRQRIARLTYSSGRSVNALRYVYSDDGKPFEWFDIGPCSTFCVVVQADCRHTAADATVSVGAVGRYLTSGG